MQSRQNSHGRALSIRDLATAVGRSYEHLRKVLAGQPVLSARLNEALCTVLLLDPVPMWQTAGAEKLKRKAKSLGMIAMGSLGIPFNREWQMLDQDERDAIETLIHGAAGRPSKYGRGDAGATSRPQMLVRAIAHCAMRSNWHNKYVISTEHKPSAGRAWLDVQVDSKTERLTNERDS